MATLADIRRRPIDNRCAVVRADLDRAIDIICTRWPEAVAAHEASAYGTGSELSPIGSGGTSDPTGNRAARGSTADQWLRQTRQILVWMLSHTPSGITRGGPFVPSKMTGTLKRCAAELVDWWPTLTLASGDSVSVGYIFDRLLSLADQALAEWPTTPTPGQEWDGVKVGGRAVTLEMCAECEKPIGGGAADPIRRIDGKPFHASSCFFRVWRRSRNSSTDAQQSA